MATVYESVHLSLWTEDGQLEPQSENPVRVDLIADGNKLQINILNGNYVRETRGESGKSVSCRDNERESSISLHCGFNESQ